MSSFLKGGLYSFSIYGNTFANSVPFLPFSSLGNQVLPTSSPSSSCLNVSFPVHPSWGIVTLTFCWAQPSKKRLGWPQKSTKKVLIPSLSSTPTPLQLIPLAENSLRSYIVRLPLHYFQSPKASGTS